MNAVLLLSGLLLSSAHADDAARFQAAAKLLTEDLDAGRYTAPVARFTDTMRDFMPAEKAGPFFKGMADSYGKTLSIDPARIEPSGNGVALVHCLEGTYEVKISLDGSGLIAGLYIVPHPATGEPPKHNATPLSVPFRGSWYVGWGGDTLQQNYHRASVNQKYAFDLLAVDASGKSFKGDGKKNTDYYAYGRDILAPGDGVVVRVVEGIPENAPGDMNGKNLVGNAVFIQHRPDEVSVLAHMIPGSIRVKEGQKVKAGDLLGKCGNSGHSSEPHLHYHLQNAPRFMDGKGIKVYFTHVGLMRGGKKRQKGEYSPVKEDVISPD